MRSGGERVRGGGATVMVAGLVMMALGVALTALSFAAAAGTGGTYIVFCGLIFGGLVMFFRGAATPTARSFISGRGGRNPRRVVYGTHARAAQLPPEDYVAPPGAMPAGYCWACGRKVRKGNAICYACGAAQVGAPPKPQRSTQSPPPPPPYAGGAYPGNPYPGNPYPGNPLPSGPYSGNPYPGSSYPNDPYPGGSYSEGSQYNPPGW